MAVRTTLLLFLPLAFAACQAARPPGPIDTMRAAPELTALSPADVAVLPVEDAVAGNPLRDLSPYFQRRVYEALVERNYSPINLDRVRSVVEAERGSSGAPTLTQLKGKFQEQAMLLVRVIGWEERSLLADGRIRATTEVKLLDSQSLQNLWSGGYEMELKVDNEGSVKVEKDEFRRQAIDRFVASLMERLPQRRPPQHTAGPSR